MYSVRACLADHEQWVRGTDARVVRIGRSVLGTPIRATSVGCAHAPHVLVVASIHANESITSDAAMHVLRTIRPRDARRQLTVVPMLNPDGVDLIIRGRVSSQWKANARGVDLNDQFPAYWATERWRRGVYAPAARDYGGPYPLSEPESRAIVRWIEAQERAQTPVRMLIALHAQGREIYWHYRDQEPKEAQWIAQRMAQASGYTAVRLYGSDAGLKDWFVHRWGRCAFTVECGCGTNPLPMTQAPSIAAEVAAIVRVALEERT